MKMVTQREIAARRAANMAPWPGPAERDERSEAAAEAFRIIEEAFSEKRNEA